MNFKIWESMEAETTGRPETGKIHYCAFEFAENSSRHTANFIRSDLPIKLFPKSKRIHPDRLFQQAQTISNELFDYRKGEWFGLAGRVR